MSEKHNCNCQFCKLYALRQVALESNDIKFVKKVMTDFADLWLNADFDRSYYQCILDGSWPQAENILNDSLGKAKNHSNRELVNG